MIAHREPDSRQSAEHLQRRARRLELLLQRQCGLFQRRQRRRLHLALLHKVVLSCQSAAGVRETLHCALEGVCVYTGWPLGHVYLTRPDDRLVPSSIWYARHPTRHRAFIEATEQHPLPPGAGLPGEVVRTQRPAWKSDLDEDEDSARSQADSADAVEVHAAFAFPVLEDGEVSAVLEFFAPHVQAPDRMLLELVDAIGRELGRLLQRKRTEEAAHRSARRFHSIAHHAPMSLLTLDREGAVTFANQAALEIFGYDEAALVGRPAEQLVPAADRPAYRRHMRRVHAGKRSPLIGRTLTIQGRRADGETFPMDVSLSTSADGEGAQNLIVMVHDVSSREAERRRFRRERRRLRRLITRLRRTEQEERGQLAHALHEHVAQLLAASQMRLSALPRQRGQFQQTAEEVCEILREAIVQTKQIAAQLSPPELYERGLISAVRNWGSHLQRMAGLRVKIISDPAADNSDAVVRLFLFQATRELLDNVVRHAATDEVSVGYRQRHGWGYLVVRDRGCGFDPRQIDRRHTSEAGDGDGQARGIGLDTLSESAEELGGEMRIEAQPGRGTRVAIAVPLRALQPQKPQAERAVRQ